MNNHRFSKRPQQHHNDDGHPAKRPRWMYQGPRLNYQHNQNFNSGRHEPPPSHRSWTNPRRGSFHPHQTPTPRPFYNQTPHQQQFFQNHNNYSQFGGPTPIYNNQQQQQQQWNNASFLPSNQFPWHHYQTHQPPQSTPRETEYNRSDSSTSSSPSYASASKPDACPAYFTTAISQPNRSPANSSPSSSTEYEPVFSTTIATKSRPAPSQPVDAVHSKKNKIADVLGNLDAKKLIQVVQYLSSFQKGVQESCVGKVKEEVREEVQVPKESKKQKDVNDNGPPKRSFKTFKANRQDCVRLLYQNKICGSCEGVFTDVGAHSCLQEENYGEWYPRMENWINGRANCDEIAKD